ncbi:MAG: protein-disulfide reductase [Flavipsychrobacter sp.]|jgi:thiol:disulfide interchange protein DsbD|nr:protein-disulfide reductase [Flavipsychrobacter sp.]
MRKALNAFLLVLFSLFASASYGQMTLDESKWGLEAKKKTGNEYELILHLQLPKQWHIYAFKPGGDGMQIAPTVTFVKNGKVKLNGPVKEKGKLLTETIDGIDGAVNMYKGNVDYVQLATISANTKITCKYSYQICNDQMCLPPTDKTITVEVKDAGGSSEITTSEEVAVVPGADTSASDTASANMGSATDTLPSNVATVTPEVKNEPESPVKTEQQSLILLFLLCFGGGLLAVVTPCVFSMIPITVSFFTKRSKTRKEGIRNAIYYSLSIIIIFTVLGLVISALFGRDALYKISTNWILNIFFFLLFVVFGISFLGAFEITLPSSWTSKTDSKAGLGSFGGIFFMALTLVIVSFSCTGPILTMLFGLLAAGGWAGPIVGMFAFSLALSLPFALCAIFPAVINNLGKSGGWLNQVKVTLGFIELALALKFFSNADLLKHWRILDREIFLALWIVIAVLLGFYLLGKLKLSHDDEPKKNIYGQEYVSIFKLFLAICSFTFALYLLPGMWGAPLNGLGQFVPPMGTQDFVITNADGSESSGVKPKKFVNEMKIYEPNVVRNNGLVTYFDYEEGIAAAAKIKKPIMLDFTGITCVNCRKMETSVWSNPKVLERLKNDFVLISLFDDARHVQLPHEDRYISKVSNKEITTLGDKCLDIQIAKYNSNAQPFYFFIDEKENLLVKEGYGYDPDVDKFIAHLDKVIMNYRKTH